MSIPPLKSITSWAIAEENNNNLKYYFPKILKIKKTPIKFNPKVVPQELCEYSEIFQKNVHSQTLERFEKDPNFFLIIDNHVTDDVCLDFIKNAFYKKRFLTEKALIKLLHQVVERNFISSIQYILDKSLELGFEIVNGKNTQKENPLMIAAKKGHLDALKELIKSGAEVNSKDSWDNTPLMIAAEKGDIDIVKELIESKADVNLEDFDNKTALMIAAEKGHIEVVIELINANANVDKQDRKGRTALMIAAKKGHTNVSIKLIKAKANVDKQNRIGFTALMIASRKGYVNLLLELIKAGANVDLQDRQGNSPLMMASWNCDLDIIKILLTAGANGELINNQGYTALLIACMSKNSIYGKELFGFDLRKEKNRKFDHINVIEKLIQEGDIKEQGQKLDLVYQNAAINHDNEILRALKKAEQKLKK